MTQPREIPIAFFKFHQLGMSTVEERLEIDDFDDFDDWRGKFDFLDGEIQGLASAAALEGTTEELLLALEYFISAGDEDLPQQLRPHGIGLGDLVGYAAGEVAIRGRGGIGSSTELSKEQA